MTKKDKLVKVKQPECLNCGYPFSGYEVFCPECGQKNKKAQITFKSFIAEVFNGFVSWDAKFWKTIVPLLIKPGKVSKDYVEGKRQRYTNPFRFYITVSIIFFLIVGLTSNYNKFKNLQGSSSEISMPSANVSFGNDGVQTEVTEANFDSIQHFVYREIELAHKRKDSIINATKVDSTLTQTQKDSIISNYKVKNGINVPFGDSELIGKFMLFQKKHPNMSIDNALDSLQIEKTFGNRFWYSRSEFIGNLISKKETSAAFMQQMFSYSSVALFILLPLFTLFLKLIYIRRKFTYVEHLIFVFHVQTVFFLLFGIFYLINFFRESKVIIPLFLLLFLIYLFIAMKKFYGQGFFKTLFKFFFANTIYFILAGIGTFAIMLITFAIY